MVATEARARHPSQTKQPGPVGLFVHSIKRVGGHVYSLTRVGFHNERPRDVMRDPINWIRPWLRHQGQQAAVRGVGHRRHTMEGANYIDVELNNKLKAKYNEDQKRDLLLVQSGGLWTAKALHKAGFLASETCPWCGADTEDLQHLWWECPQHEHCRSSAKALLGETWRSLPRCLSTHGIPPEAAGIAGSKLWRSQDCPQTEKRDEEPQELHGDDRAAWAAVLDQ